MNFKEMRTNILMTAEDLAVEPDVETIYKKVLDLIDHLLQSHEVLQLEIAPLMIQMAAEGLSLPLEIFGIQASQILALLSPDNLRQAVSQGSVEGPRGQSWSLEGLNEQSRHVVSITARMLLWISVKERVETVTRHEHARV